MAPFLFGAGLALVLVLLVAIYRKLRDLDDLPSRVWAVARQERARDEARALAALQDAATAKASTITASLRAHEVNLVRECKELVSVAEARARLAEQRTTGVDTALSAATALVRELHAVLNGLGRLPVTKDEPDPDARQTLQMVVPPGTEEAEELTEVAPRPIEISTATFSGLRLKQPSATAGGAQ